MGGWIGGRRRLTTTMLDVSANKSDASVYYSLCRRKTTIFVLWLQIRVAVEIALVITDDGTKA